MSKVSSSTATSIAPRPLSWSLPEHRRFTREEYHRMAEVGLIEPGARVELLNGEIIDVSPVSPLHASVSRKLNDFFALRLAGKFLCSGPNPQATAEFSEPEPDYQVLRRREDYYADRHPAPDEVGLLIEVSDSSLQKDLGPKMQIYAAAGIVEYWVVDLLNRKLVVHTDPDQAAANYRSVASFSDTDSVAPGIADDCVLDLAWLFGPPTPAA